MVVEIDENKILEMKEDIQDYVELIKRYDSLVKEKNKIIKAYDKELLISREIIVCLLDLLNQSKLNKKTKKEIKVLIEKVQNS